MAGTIAGGIAMVRNGMLIARARWALFIDFAEITGTVFVSCIVG
jgi:hypothetical protein